MDIFRLFSNDTTTHWAQSASASCTGWFCRASASNIIAPTQADEIVSMLALVVAGGIVCVFWLCVAVWRLSSHGEGDSDE